MANQQPPEPPPSPNSPIGTDGKPAKSGPNWRVLILLMIGAGIIFMAINFSDDSGKAKEINVNEFVKDHENKKVLIG